jgi:PAS domain S-box-containing protein
MRDAKGEFTGTIGMAMDISDRVRAEQRIRRSEARYRSLVEAMQEGLLTIKANGKISFINAPFARMLGRTRKDILGWPAADFVAGESRETLEGMFASARPETGAVEVVWEHSSGKRIYSLFSLSVSRDDKGEVVGYSAIVTDTTERKALESQLLQSQKLEAIGQLAAGIAHEINTPAQYVGSNVRFIKSAFDDILAVCGRTRQFMQSARTAPPTSQDMDQLAALMAERDIDFLEAEVPSAIAQTLDGVERISTIVRSMKQFAHPGETAMAPADLNEAMRSTVTVSRNEWKYVADLETDLDETLPLVVCMVGEINQVVLNLIVNAAHAIAEVVKKDPEHKGRITLSTRYAPPWAEIRVADTGAGIPPEVQGKIFDPFFTTKEVGKGTGQGLTISRSIVVEKHGGQLVFETEPGAGTTFVVRLPLVQGKERET